MPTLHHMCLRYFVVLCILLSVISGSSHAQGLICPLNVDFELGNTSIWNYYTGSCCPVSTPSSGAPVAGRHTLTSGATVDPYGGFPIVSPGGGAYSMKLGNTAVGGQAEKARYYVHVPATTSNYSLVYRYAVVFQDPGHSVADQPRFQVTAYDSATGLPIECSDFLYVSEPDLPGFYVSPSSATVYYRPWSTGILNLSGLGGSTIIVDFVSADCGLGGHFGYGYFDMTCGLFAVTANVCDTSLITIEAPAGFHSYEWYDSSFTTMLDTARIFHPVNPSGPTTYAVILFPDTGYGCADTLFSTITPSQFFMSRLRDTTICPGTSVLLHPHASDTGTLTYAWSPPLGLVCTTCDSVVAMPGHSTQYIVDVSSTGGCSRSDTVDVTVALSVVPMHDTSLCTTDGVTLTTAISGVASPLNYSWSPTSGLSCSTCIASIATNTATTTYVVTVSDTIGCTAADTVVVARGKIEISLRDTAICPSTALLLDPHVTSPDTALVYAWFPSSGLACATCSTLSLPAGAIGQYVLSVSSATGCIGADTATVSFSMSLAPMHDTALCDSSGVSLMANASGLAAPFTYSWSPAVGLSCTACPNPVAAHSMSTTYVAVVTDAAGCSIAESATIVRDILLLTPASDTIFCQGLDITMTAGITSTAYTPSYSWAPASSLSCVTCASVVGEFSSVTTVTVTATNSLGCTLTDEFEVTPDFYTMSLSNDTVVCDYADVLLSVSSTGIGTHYAWTAGYTLDCDTCTSLMSSIATSQVYNVAVTDTLGCTIHDSVFVWRNSMSMIPMKDTIICKGTGVRLQAVNTPNAYDVSYRWFPSDGLSCTNCEAPIATATRSMSWYVIATDRVGCVATDTVDVKLDLCDIWFPSAFTPNGDGRNDIARVIGHLGFFEGFSLGIYNRFGQMVFYTEDIYSGWNGVFNGVPQDIGVYFYKILYSLNSEHRMMTGDITLIR